MKVAALVLILAALGFGIWQWIAAPGAYDGRSLIAVALLIAAAFVLFVDSERRRRA